MQYSKHFDKRYRDIRGLGSFNKEEVIHHLITNEGFRKQEHADKTILDNTDQVGNNCLTYMETVDGLTTFSTIYNKMVQVLESKDVGQSWNDWVCQKDTCLAKSRDLSWSNPCRSVPFFRGGRSQ